MKFTYGNLNAAELRGDSTNELLVNIEADLEIADEGKVIYSERAFPVVELARELITWFLSPREENFEFRSLSFEEEGAVRILGTPEGWLVGSVFEPEKLSRPFEWEEISKAVLGFAVDLRQDLERLGFGAWLVPDLPTVD